MSETRPLTIFSVSAYKQVSRQTQILNALNIYIFYLSVKKLGFLLIKVLFRGKKEGEVNVYFFQYIIFFNILYVLATLSSHTLSHLGISFIFSLCWK